MGCWRPLTPSGKQQLDTSHYQKYFKVSKLPQPEAVVVLLQRMKPDSKDPGRPGCGTKTAHTLGSWAKKEEEREKEEAVPSAPPCEGQ